MADQLSIKTRALIGLSANPNTEFQVGEKVQSLALTRTRGTSAADIQAGAGGMQASRFDVYEYSLACMTTAALDAVLHNAWGKRAYIIHQERGEGTGRPQAVLDGPVSTLTLTYDLSSDMGSWSMSVAVDGAPDEDAQS